MGQWPYLGLLPDDRIRFYLVLFPCGKRPVDVLLRINILFRIIFIMFAEYTIVYFFYNVMVFFMEIN